MVARLDRAACRAGDDGALRPIKGVLKLLKVGLTPGKTSRQLSTISGAGPAIFPFACSMFKPLTLLNPQPQ